MRNIPLAFVAAGLLAASAWPAAAAGTVPTRVMNGESHSSAQPNAVDLSARRYNRGRYYRGGGYRYGYARPYYRPYAYGPGPYYGYGYYRPAPFPFFPFFF